MTRSGGFTPEQERKYLPCKNLKSLAIGCTGCALVHEACPIYVKEHNNCTLYNSKSHQRIPIFVLGEIDFGDTEPADSVLFNKCPLREYNVIKTDGPNREAEEQREVCERLYKKFLGEARKHQSKKILARGVEKFVILDS